VPFVPIDAVVQSGSRAKLMVGVRERSWDELKPASFRGGSPEVLGAKKGGEHGGEAPAGPVLVVN
jgi:hypothetical protein